MTAAAANTLVGNAVTTAMSGVPVRSGWTWTAYQSTATGGQTTTSWTTTTFGGTLMVQVDADLDILFPGLGYLLGNSSNTIHITTYCMMCSEAN
jgi:hypothetical protein